MLPTKVTFYLDALRGCFSDEAVSRFIGDHFVVTPWLLAMTFPVIAYSIALSTTVYILQHARASISLYARRCRDAIHVRRRIV